MNVNNLWNYLAIAFVSYYHIICYHSLMIKIHMIYHYKYLTQIISWYTVGLEKVALL